MPGSLVRIVRSQKKNTRYATINKRVDRIIRRLMALAYLPAHAIAETYTKIRDSIKDPVVKTGMDNFLRYFERQWLTKRPPEEWSQFKHIRTTNNPSESLNHILNVEFGEHPHPWNFVRKYSDRVCISHTKLPGKK